MRGVQICTPYRVHRYVSIGDFVMLYHLRHGNRSMYGLTLFHNAKEYGSILNVPVADYDKALDYIEELKTGELDLITVANIEVLERKLPKLVKQAKIMAAKYDVVVTNPPYMGGSNMNPKLSAYVKKNYPDSKSDLFAVRISMLSLLSKVSNRKVAVEFFQSEPVTDAIKEATYIICFMDDEGNVISNENIYVADNREAESTKRFFKMQFMLKNQVYDTSKKYYIVAVNDDTEAEIIRHPVKIDIVSDDIGLFSWQKYLQYQKI